MRALYRLQSFLSERHERALWALERFRPSRFESWWLLIELAALAKLEKKFVKVKFYLLKYSKIILIIKIIQSEILPLVGSKTEGLGERLFCLLPSSLRLSVTDSTS